MNITIGSTLRFIKTYSHLACIYKLYLYYYNDANDTNDMGLKVSLSATTVCILP